MHIVAMEMYYSFQYVTLPMLLVTSPSPVPAPRWFRDKLDDGLQKALKDFISKTGIKNWNKV